MKPCIKKIPPVVLAIVFLNGKALSIGQDELNPAPPSQEPGNQLNSEKTGSPSQKDGEKAPPPPTEFSKSIADKAFISSATGLTSLSGSSGDWTGGLSGDFSVGLQVTELSLGKAFFIFRYSPTDVTVTAEKQSYRGVVEMFNFGGLIYQKSSGNLTYLWGGELAYVKVSLSSVDNFTEDQSLENGSANFNISGGADYLLTKKVSIGPRAIIGAGAVTYINIAANFQFML